MQRSSRSTATGGPPPPSFTGMIVVTGNNGDLPLATQRRVESIASGDRPSPSLDRIYQLGLWLAIFFAIFLRLPPNKFLRIPPDRVAVNFPKVRLGAGMTSLLGRTYRLCTRSSLSRIGCQQSCPGPGPSRRSALTCE